MRSWRDSTPDRVQDDLDGLAGAAIDVAQQFLNRTGEFYPFGIALSSDGETRMLEADPDLGEHPESQAIIDSLYLGIASDREALRAVTVVADVKADGSDAIRVRLEHRDGGPALEILVRYTKKRFRKQMVYGQTTVSETDRQVWSIP